MEVLYPPEKGASFFVGCQISMPFNAFLRNRIIDTSDAYILYIYNFREYDLNGFYIHMYVIYVYYSFFLVVSIVLEACHSSTAGCVEAADDPEGVATRKPKFPRLLFRGLL